LFEEPPSAPSVGVEPPPVALVEFELEELEELDELVEEELGFEAEEEVGEEDEVVEVEVEDLPLSSPKPTSLELPLTSMLPCDPLESVYTYSPA